MSETNLTLDHPIFHDSDEARRFLEKQRWPNGPVCPHCGSENENTLLKGKKHRPGLYQCNACREQFTVTVGTVFERSRVPLHKWMLATHLMTSSKKGFSAHQLHRTIGVTYKTAWFMAHRIREAMREPVRDDDDQLGGGGKTVEVDETFWGNKKPRGEKKGRGYSHKEKILSLVERDGRARSFHVSAVNAKTLRPIMKQQINAETHIMTDEAAQYVGAKNQFGSTTRSKLLEDFASHEYVCHGVGEYVRGDVHTNTIESYFAIMKRGLNGVYHHVGAQHLKRYIGEFDFRYNYRIKLGFGDLDRTVQALRGIEGKRLTYLPTN